MMSPQIWSWILSAMGVLCFWLAGRKIWWAWYVGLSTQCVWLAYSLATQQWGFLVGVALYTAVYTKNARLWTSEHRTDLQTELARIKEREIDELEHSILAAHPESSDVASLDSEPDQPPPFIYRGIYRRRALVAEARRWDGSYDVAQELLEWVGPGRATYQEAVVPAQLDDIQPLPAVPAHLWIHREEGALEIVPGDYIVAEPFPRPGREFDRLTPEEVVDNLELLQITEVTA